MYPAIQDVHKLGSEHFKHKLVVQILWQVPAVKTRYPFEQVLHFDTLVYEHSMQLETAQVKHFPELDGVNENGFKQVLHDPLSLQVPHG